MSVGSWSDDPNLDFDDQKITETFRSGWCNAIIVETMIHNDTFWLFVRNWHISGQRETSSKENQMLSFFGTLFVHGPNTNRWKSQTDNFLETFDIALSPNLWNLYMPGLQKFIDTYDSWLVQYFFLKPSTQTTNYHTGKQHQHNPLQRSLCVDD